MDKSNWYASVWFVLLMLFLVLGPLGLPLLWKSPRFSSAAKIVLTAATVAYTVWILYGAGAVVQESLQGLGGLAKS